jgi:hypothetical protein
MAESKSDDQLVERIRARAWDPARCRGSVGVPVWAVIAYADDPATARKRASLAREGKALSRGPNAKWTTVKGGSLVAVEFYRDAAHEPPRPRLTHEDVDEAERRMRVRMPALLRRLYTEVGDGGFGPAFGLPALMNDDGEPPMIGMRPSSDDEMPSLIALGLPLCDYGCAIWDWVSLDGPDHVVRRLEIAGDPESDAAAVLRTAGIPLTAWFEDWLAT